MPLGRLDDRGRHGHHRGGPLLRWPAGRVREHLGVERGEGGRFFWGFFEISFRFFRVIFRFFFGFIGFFFIIFFRFFCFF